MAALGVIPQRWAHKFLMNQGTYRPFSWVAHHLYLVTLVTLVTFSTVSPTLAENRDTVRIAGSAWIGDAPTWVADQRGLFNRDLDDGAPAIEVQLHGSGLEALKHLLAGEAEFALAATTPTALALVGALDDSGTGSSALVVLASVALSNQSHYVISLSHQGINSPQDLAGRRVGIMLGTSSHYGWTRFSGFHGLDDADIELVDMPVTDMGDALKRGDLDAAVIWQPWDLTLREALDDRLTTLSMRMLYTINWLLLTRQELVAEHPEVVERVLRGYIDAMELIDAEPEGALALHATAIGQDEADLAPLAANILWRLGLNWSVLVNLGAQFEWLATWPQFDELVIPHPGDYLHGDALRQVAPELVTLPDYLLTTSPPDTHQ